MFNFPNMMGNAMSKASSLGIGRKPMEGQDNIASVGRGASSMFPSMPGMDQSYSPPQIPNSQSSFQSPDTGGFMERFRNMMGGNTGFSGGMGMNSPGIMDYRRNLMQNSGQPPMQSGFNFPMMRF